MVKGRVAGKIANLSSNSKKDTQKNLSSKKRFDATNQGGYKCRAM